ncbi:MAG: methionine adenosyltransferase [Flavobacteriales bacterium]|nr:methionine adenosyltransferase [Flavobacteriales bacterium]
MAYLFTSESVSEGHPDKVADQISDAMLDEFLKHDPNSKVACETFCTTGLVVVGGEISSQGEGKVKVDEIVRRTVKNIGYTKASYKFDSESCGVISAMHEQSGDIRQGVEEGAGLYKEQGAGDQGMMFGYATNESDNYLPISLDLSHLILREMAEIRKEGKVMKYLGPDSKSQVTIEYNDRGKAHSVHTIVVSTQHDDFDEEERMLAQIKHDVREIVLRRVMKKLPVRIRRMFGRGWQNRITLHVNPTGKFVIGGPHGDVGLTGRKIIVDTYGGRGAHGGGAFSGKDSSKVDRSAAYAARHIAKNLVAAGVCDQALVQVAYAIGVAQPVSLYVNTYKTSKVWLGGKKLSDGEISKMVAELFDMRPAAIVSRFGLRNPVFSETAAYGHFGRESEVKEVEVYYNGPGVVERKGRFFKKVETFAWEKLDRVNELVKVFELDQVPEIPDFMNMTVDED